MIQLVQNDEKMTYENGGSKIFYRRISALKRGEIIRKHTNKGKTDWFGATTGILEYAVIGWENVQVKGENILYDADVLKGLPESVRSDLVDLLGGTGEDGEDSAKN